MEDSVRSMYALYKVQQTGEEKGNGKGKGGGVSK